MFSDDQTQSLDIDSQAQVLATLWEDRIAILIKSNSPLLKDFSPGQLSTALYKAVQTHRRLAERTIESKEALVPAYMSHAMVNHDVPDVQSIVGRMWRYQRGLEKAYTGEYQVDDYELGQLRDIQSYLTDMQEPSGGEVAAEK